MNSWKKSAKCFLFVLTLVISFVFFTNNCEISTILNNAKEFEKENITSKIYTDGSNDFFSEHLSSTTVFTTKEKSEDYHNDILNKPYTIGITNKKAEAFFDSLCLNYISFSPKTAFYIVGETTFFYKIRYADYENEFYISKKAVSILECNHNKHISTAFDSTVPEELLCLTDYFIEQLPEQIKIFLERKEIKIVLKDGSLKALYHGDKEIKNIIGLASLSSNTIYLKANPAFLSEAIYHEIGHFIDQELDYIYDNEDFQQAFAEERDLYLKHVSDFEYAVSDAQEYFAEIFQDYLKGLDLSSIPKTEAKIKGVVNNDTLYFFILL